MGCSTLFFICLGLCGIAQTGASISSFVHLDIGANATSFKVDLTTPALSNSLSDLHSLVKPDCQFACTDLFVYALNTTECPPASIDNCICQQPPLQALEACSVCTLNSPSLTSSERQRGYDDYKLVAAECARNNLTSSPVGSGRDSAPRPHAGSLPDSEAPKSGSTAAMVGNLTQIYQLYNVDVADYCAPLFNALLKKTPGCANITWDQCTCTQPMLQSLVVCATATSRSSFLLPAEQSEVTSSYLDVVAQCKADKLTYAPAPISVSATSPNSTSSATNSTITNSPIPISSSNSSSGTISSTTSVASPSQTASAANGLPLSFYLPSACVVGMISVLWV